MIMEYVDLSRRAGTINHTHIGWSENLQRKCSYCSLFENNATKIIYVFIAKKCNAQKRRMDNVSLH